MISKALVVGSYHKKVEELASLGADVDVVMPKRWGHQRAELTEGRGYKIHFAPVVFSGKNHFYFYRGLKALAREINPDVVHIDEESYSYVTFQAMGIGRKESIPATFFNWQNIYKQYPFPFSWIEQQNFRMSFVAIAGNQDAKAVLLRKGFEKPIYVIPQFGVDTEVFQRLNSSELKQELFGSIETNVVGYAGRLVEEKGILILLEAFVQLPDDAHLLMLGSGPLKGQIANKAINLGISKRVLVVDHVPSHEMPLYLNCMSCLVLPSLTRPNWKEQFGRILIEAMSCEVPVVGSDSGEIPNVIEDAGIIVPEGNAKALSKALQTILYDQDVHEKLSSLGRHRVNEYFTQKKVAQQTMTVYERMLRERM